MPKVVSNTTPIISLLKIGRLEILKDLYKEIYIPQEVFSEIEAGKHKKNYLNLSEFEWIKIEQIQDRKSIAYFLDLDKGEAEAIILATEIEADLILLDEALGRFHAKNTGLKVTGTIGVLIKAKKKGLISEVKPLIFELREQGIWLSDGLIDRILELTHEQ